MTEIRVVVVSAEEADYGVAEFWCGAEQLGMTIFDDGQLQFRIDARADGSPWVVEAAGLARALSDATRQLAAY
ncbi:MAG: hypothetical protein E6G41_05080 [Actinobacteria bacterium]|nr:MAG: hypothetical protein E6G41_05080 [Actinomycetota bacterium]